jgi:hypothetical protein
LNTPAVGKSTPQVWGIGSMALSTSPATQAYEVCSRHSEGLVCRCIMPPPKPFVALPMHSLRLWWELIEHARAASKLRTDFLRIDDVAVTRHSLSC